MHSTLRLAAVSFSLVTAWPAAAQSAATLPPDAGAATAQIGGDSLTIGGGAVYLPDYEGSNDDHFVPAPGAIGSVKGFNFTLAGNRFSADLIPNQSGPTLDFQAGPVVVVDFNRSNIKSIDDVRIRALGKRDTAIEVGGYVGIGKTGVITSDYDRLSISLSYRKGVSGAQRAGILSPTINYFTPLGTKTGVGLFASAERAERGYARSYFDVNAAQSLASGLPVYSTRGGWKDWSVGLIGTQSITGDLLHGFKIVGGVNYKRLLNDFAQSPVVRIAGRRDQWTGVIGLAYTF
ncbi:MipA/OmpV family protein [uncultured Sphingomonas sp.]|uniref:MipA/OmpV family protein n=1 Tax=uncultured Sphingomonas sp. TaxID=158754 RepID=UPI0035C9EAF3